ncbi:hypothetical protein [Polaribacter sp.]|uniref:hypothetical protein n=1 Tax=Polaribacter sp. TaxID=1920175 RepID=UPI004047A498
MITILNISIIFAITFIWNRFVMTKFVNMLSNPKISDENDVVSTSFFFDNKKEILKIANYFYYILALFISILISIA